MKPCNPLSPLCLCPCDIKAGTKVALMFPHLGYWHEITLMSGTFEGKDGQLCVRTDELDIGFRTLFEIGVMPDLFGKWHPTNFAVLTENIEAAHLELFPKGDLSYPLVEALPEPATKSTEELWEWREWFQ